MGIDLPIQTEESSGSGRPRAELPPTGDYEVLRIATEQNNFGDTVVQLTLMNVETDNVIQQSYKYKIVNNKLAATTGAGRLRTALDSLDLPTWDIEGERLRFEPVTFTLQGGTKSGQTYQVFIPTARASAASNSGSSGGNGSADSSGYSDDGVAALLGLLAENQYTQAALFKAAAEVPAIKDDKALLNDIATQKAFSKIPGIKKEGNKFFVG